MGRARAMGETQGDPDDTLSGTDTSFPWQRMACTRPGVQRVEQRAWLKGYGAAMGWGG